MRFAACVAKTQLAIIKVTKEAYGQRQKYRSTMRSKSDALSIGAQTVKIALIANNVMWRFRPPFINTCH